MVEPTRGRSLFPPFLRLTFGVAVFTLGLLAPSHGWWWILVGALVGLGLGQAYLGVREIFAAR